MKRSIRLLVLMLAAALGAASIAFSDPATFAGTPRDRPGTHAVYEHGTEHPINAFARNGQSNNTRLVSQRSAERIGSATAKVDVSAHDESGSLPNTGSLGN